MENRLNNQESPNYYKRKFAAIIVFAIFFMILGRHLTFLPTINLSMNSKEEDLIAEIKKITQEKKGFYSIYFKDLNSEIEFGLDESQINTAASVNKVPIIAALYLLDRDGKVSLDDRVTIQENDVQDYGTGSIRYQEMPQTYSLRNLAKLALKESDNTAAHVIEVKIGEDNVQKLVDSWGMKQTNMIDNKTSAKDMSIIFQKIYKGEIADAANTKELLQFLSNTDFEDRMPKELPKSAAVYHKTGDEEGYVHDVGLIKTNKGIYYLGVLTSDVGGKEEETKSTIGQISKKIFDTFEY